MLNVKQTSRHLSAVVEYEHNGATVRYPVFYSYSLSHGCPYAATSKPLGHVAKQNAVLHILANLQHIVYKQIAEDMKAMKKRHLQTVQELEENFQFTAQETQVKEKKSKSV